MPDTGYSPAEIGGPIDNSGGGIDPSYYYALAPGSPFPGQQQNWLGYMTGNPYGTPGYAPPSWLSWLAGHVRGGETALNAHTGNVNSPGAGQAPSPDAGGYPYQFFSGPGAAYGPASGPGTGLVDMGRPPGEIWDHPEQVPDGTSESGPTKKKGKGGQQAGHFTFQPYRGLNYHSSFVDWQPVDPGTAPTTPTRFVAGSGASLFGPPPSTPSADGKKAGKAGKGPGGGSGTGPGKPGGGGGPGAGPSPGRPGQPGSGGAAGGPTNQQTGDQATPFGYTTGLRLNPSANSGPGPASSFGGVNTNYLDYLTPSWLKDPTTGTYDTAGMPNATPFAPTGNNRGGPQQAQDQFITALHDAGLSNDDIQSLVGPYGYKLDNSGNWQWAWGTGPVLRDPTTGAYGFARGLSGTGGRDGGGEGSGKQNAADALTSGWTPTARYV